MIKKTHNTLSDTAVFIDGDWLHHATRRLNKKIDYTQLWIVLHAHFGPKTPIYFYGTVDPQKKNQIHFVDALQKIGYIVKTSKLRRFKNRVFSKGLNVNLALEAITLPPEFRTIVLISGDNDFVSLLEKARKNNRSTIVVTVPFTGRQLIQSAEQFINVDTFLANLIIGKRFPRIKKKKQTKISPPQNWYIEQGTSFAAYLTVRKLFASAKQEITLVDPYIDDQILQMIQLISKDIPIQIITDKISVSDFCIQIKKLRKDGYQIHVHKTKTFHDRFLGIDNTWWHSGHSFKNLGEKDSLLNKVTDEIAIKKLCERIEKELNDTEEYCKA